MKKIKYLLVVFVAFMLVGAIKINAETYSDAFKAILNNTNKITLTNNGRDFKDTLISMYINQYNDENEGEYYYYTDTNTCSDNYSKCNVQMIDRNTNVAIEEHLVDIDYVEEYSDEFKSIIKNDSFVVNNSTLQNSKISIINNELEKYKTDDYSFVVQEDSCNEDYSKCTITLYLSDYTQEQHELSIKYVEEYSDEFKQFVSDGKIIITESTLDSKYTLRCK